MKQRITVLLLVAFLFCFSGCTADDAGLFYFSDREYSNQDADDSVIDYSRGEETVLGDTAEPTEPSAAEAATTAPLHSALYDPEISVEELIGWFNEVCLDAEVVNSGDASVLQKWDRPIYYYINGVPNREDMATVERTADWLNSIEGFPGIYPTEDMGQANLNIYFCSEQQMLQIMGEHFRGNDGAVVFWYENDAIYNENICIRTDLDQELRNCVIIEELYNGMGPVQDTDLRKDSIIYAGFSQPQEPTKADKLIMQLLYHPQMECGMDADECARVIRSLYW